MHGQREEQDEKWNTLKKEKEKERKEGNRKREKEQVLKDEKIVILCREVETKKRKKRKNDRAHKYVQSCFMLIYV